MITLEEHGRLITLRKQLQCLVKPIDNVSLFSLNMGVQHSTKKHVLDLSLHGIVENHERLFDLAGFNGCTG